MIKETLLRSATVKASEKLTQILECGYDPEQQHVFSEEFEKKIKKLTRRANHPVLYQSVRRVASIILAMILAGGIWLTFDVDARATFIGWIKDTYKTFITYRYSGPNAETLSVKYYLSYLPEGYTEVFSEHSDNSGDIIYVNAEGKYLIFSYISDPTSSSIQIDTHNTKHYQVTVDGNSADYFEALTAEVSSGILWGSNNNQYLFYLSGFFDQKQLIYIAENIEVYKK